VSADGTEPTFGLWKSTLDREGVPYDTMIATQAPPLTAGQLADGTTRAKYQAVILATGNLAYFDGSVWGSAFSTDEWNTLRAFEAAFGIRQVSAYIFPGPEYGLNFPTGAGDWGGTVGQVTTSGSGTFAELVGPVKVDSGSWGYETTPLDPTNFNTLVTGKGGGPMVGVYTHPEDGRQELVVTVDANQFGNQGLLLQHGILRWVTKGVYLGYKRAYLGMHIDDIFLPNDRWDVNLNQTITTRPIKMNLFDVAKAALWESQQKLRIDMVFNADGANTRDGGLTLALLFARSLFGWVNHTFTHENLDTVSTAVARDEIQRNIDWARANRIPFDATELVTGEHSGLNNPNLPAALTQTGIRYIASDWSRTPLQQLLGPALTLPRYPTNAYYNVGTKAEQLDEYNYIFFENCTNTPTTTCFTAPASWQTYLDNSTSQIVSHLLQNDPRPHYFHQSNLTEEGVFYVLMNEVLTRYRAILKPTLVQPTMKDAAATLQRFDKWRAALNAGQASAYLDSGKVFITSSVSIDAPVTGTAVGEVYGGDRSGWVHVNAGQTVQATPTSTPAPTPAPSPSAIQGSAAVGSTLTAPAADDVVARIWLRCNASGTACGPIRRASGRTYTPGAGDVGATLRVIVISHDDGDWDVLRSDPTALVAGAVAAATASAVNAAAPQVGGEPQVAEALVADPGVWVGAPAADYRYSWSRCEDGGCVAIDGADDRTYRPGDEDLGTRLKVTVRAEVGTAVSEAASSAVTAPVEGTEESRSSEGLTEAKANEAQDAAEAAAAAAGAAAGNGG
jgi:hypothetical protein